MRLFSLCFSQYMSTGAGSGSFHRGVRPYLFEKLLLGLFLQQNGSVGRQTKKQQKKTAALNIHDHKHRKFYSSLSTAYTFLEGAKFYPTDCSNRVFRLLSNN